MHLIVPSMPGLVESFGTTRAAVQLTLTLYMLALAIATLGCGPLSDRFGRRPVVLGALALFTIASAVCASAPSIEVLIAARIRQAIGGAAGLTLGRAMVRDCLDANRAASMIATLSMIMSVIPALSPALGGFWRALRSRRSRVRSARLHADDLWRAGRADARLLPEPVRVAVGGERARHQRGLAAGVPTRGSPALIAAG